MIELQLLAAMLEKSENGIGRKRPATTPEKPASLLYFVTTLACTAAVSRPAEVPLTRVFPEFPIVALLAKGASRFDALVPFRKLAPERLLFE